MSASAKSWSGAPTTTWIANEKADPNLPDLGGAVAVSRLIPHVGVNQVPPQQPLTHQSRLFHHPRGAHILYIAYRADTENRGLRQAPLHDFGQRLGHQPLSPPRTRQDVAEFH